MNEAQEKGICYLVGAGPGDLGLVTLKAKECIEKCDVLVYDALSSAELVGWAKKGCELIFAGKRAADHAIPQDQINAIIVEKTLQGKVVTRLKGGDPMIFGRGGEEAAELAEAGVRFEIVPGISSTIAGPAYAGIPVTHRDHCSQLTIFTGHEDPTKGETSLDFAQLAKTPGTKVFVMGVSRLRGICAEFIKGGGSSRNADCADPVGDDWKASNGSGDARDDCGRGGGEEIQVAGRRCHWQCGEGEGEDQLV
ncbi:uroporphyrinogen-III C-methyltransferase [Akkermansiaceae bacterium]|nr:uroporphyrinogen-III C-methyltransferase [Akkermansiaceae bacterium]MDB4383712.1 uroporphyrinogen-III C-methyltransferase [Akkermansiaceae bacterium]